MARSLLVSEPPGSPSIDIGPSAATAASCRLRSAARPELPAIAVNSRIATTTAIDWPTGNIAAARWSATSRNRHAAPQRTSAISREAVTERSHVPELYTRASPPF
jgi:hypothetical protein